MKFHVLNRVGTGKSRKITRSLLGLWLGPQKHEPKMQEFINFQLGFYRMHSMRTECRLE
jgi:hypothetical protein